MNAFLICLILLIVLFLYAAIDPVIYKTSSCLVLYYFNYKGQRKEFILWKFQIKKLLNQYQNLI